MLQVYDMCRRMVLIGLIIFIMPGTSTQVAVGLLLAIISLCVHLYCQAYVHDDDGKIVKQQHFSLMRVILCSSTTLISYCTTIFCQRDCLDTAYNL
jgi:NADH:ubiquinone oxidoreductase subunit 5 (subunit L)/multisubunit Na+/H+ antiporter MnhA subunit